MSIVMPPPPPTIAPTPAPKLSAKEARADSKAAKARAKALRPWYRKKRFIGMIAVVAIIGIMIASQASKNTPSTKSSNPTATVSGIDKGIGSADASADVKGATLGPVDTLGFRAVSLTVTNNSSKRSNYLIDLAVESPDGAIQYDTSIASVNNLEAGQTTTIDSLPITKTVPADAVVKIKTVTRLASN
jgi:hypothetical protein